MAKRLGKGIQVAVVAGTANRVAGQSATRVAIRFFPQQGGNYALSDNQIASQALGIWMTSAGAPVEFTRERDGAIVGGEWWIVPGAGMTNFYYVDVQE